MNESTMLDALIEEDEDFTASKYLTFALGDEEYGINISVVTEIIGIQKITEVPDVPEFIKGVINLRGKVIPVIDMHLRFGQEEREHDERTCIIVVNLESTAVGLIVDTVAEVIDIENKDIDPPPQITRTGEKAFVEGLGRIGSEVKILLNIHKVLATDAEALVDLGVEA